MPAPSRPYVLYFDGSSPPPLTQQFARGLPVWTLAGQVLLNTSRGPTALSESAGLWTVPGVGGEPEPLLTFPAGTTNIVSITPDGATVAALRRDEAGVWGIWTGFIASGTLDRYEPVPFAPTGIVNQPALSFSPEGRQLLLMWNPSAEREPEGEQAWLLPYRPDAGDPFGASSKPCRCGLRRSSRGSPTIDTSSRRPENAASRRGSISRIRNRAGFGCSHCDRRRCRGSRAARRDHGNGQRGRLKVRCDGRGGDDYFLERWARRSAVWRVERGGRAKRATSPRTRELAATTVCWCYCSSI